MLPDGSDGVNELSYLMLEVMDEIHLLQPQGNIQLSRKNADRFLQGGLPGDPERATVIRRCSTPTALSNRWSAAARRIEDAREGGTSGCVETGAFGKEAYILTGYLNTPKILEITLNNGVDPRTGKRIGIETGDPRDFESFDELFEAFERQLNHFVDIKVAGNQFIEQHVRRGHAGGVPVGADRRLHREGQGLQRRRARGTTPAISSASGSATITDSLSAIRKHVFEDATIGMAELLDALDGDFDDAEALRLEARQQDAALRKRRRLCRRAS